LPTLGLAPTRGVWFVIIDVSEGRFKSGAAPLRRHTSFHVPKMPTAGARPGPIVVRTMFKWLFRWLVRTVVLAAVLFIIALVVDYFQRRVPANSVLVVDLSGPVVEHDNSGLINSLRGVTQTPLDKVLRAITSAAHDRRIVGLAIKVIDPSMEMAQGQELASSIRAFRASHKWTSAYIETAGETGPGNLAYLVGSAAQEVSLMPEGELNIVGVQMRELFMRGTLDWLGIKPQFDAIGQFKTAANIFTQQDFTPAQKEEDQSLVDDLYGQLVDQLAAQRHLPRATVRQLINRAPLTADDGLQAHLVDRLEYEDQFDQRIKHFGGGKRHHLVDFMDYTRAPLLGSLGGGSRVAVIYASGAIQRGSGGFDPLLSPQGTAMGSDDMVDALTQARQDNAVKAVVLRIDSPGGSVIASELIRREVERTAQAKPLVVSMSGYAASGGYWIAIPGKLLFADPGTITGSIGVLGGKFNIAAATTKLGINTGAVAQGDNVAMFDPFTDFTPAQATLFHDHLLGDVYRRFVARVAAGRKLSVPQVEQIAQGRVWTGRQALGIKLIDRLGGLSAALSQAAVLAGLPANQPLQIETLPRPPGFFSQLLGLGQASQARAQSLALARVAAPWLELIERQRALSGAAGALYCAHLPVVR